MRRPAVLLATIAVAAAAAGWLGPGPAFAGTAIHRSDDTGKNRVDLRPGELDDGAYQLTVAAYEDANRRPEARRRFTLGS